MDTGLGGLALCPFGTSKGGMEPLTIALSFDGVSIMEGRRALERRFVYPVRIGTKLLDLGIRWPPYNKSLEEVSQEGREYGRIRHVG